MNLQALVSRWDQTKVHLRKAESEESTAKLDLCEELAKHFGIDEYDCQIGLHACAKSPIRLCVYDSKEDVNHDDCLICHDPHERA